MKILLILLFSYYCNYCYGQSCAPDCITQAGCNNTLGGCVLQLQRDCNLLQKYCASICFNNTCHNVSENQCLPNDTIDISCDCYENDLYIVPQPSFNVNYTRGAAPFFVSLTDTTQNLQTVIESYYEIVNVVSSDTVRVNKTATTQVYQFDISDSYTITMYVVYGPTQYCGTISSDSVYIITYPEYFGTANVNFSILGLSAAIGAVALTCSCLYCYNFTIFKSLRREGQLATIKAPSKIELFPKNESTSNLLEQQSGILQSSNSIPNLINGGDLNLL